MGQLDTVTDPRHGNHPLVLNDDTGKYYRCDGCHHLGNGARYRCNACDFDLHPACLGVGQEMGQLDTVTDPRHRNHPLVLNDTGKYYRCDGCHHPGNGARYRCNACDFDLHPACLGEGQAQPQVQNAQPANQNPRRGLGGAVGSTLKSVALSVGTQILFGALGIDIDVGDLIGGDDEAEA